MVLDTQALVVFVLLVQRHISQQAFRCEVLLERLSSKKLPCKKALEYHRTSVLILSSFAHFETGLIAL